MSPHDGVRWLRGLGAALPGHEEEILRCSGRGGGDGVPPASVLREARLHRTVLFRTDRGEARILKWQARRPPLDFWRDVLAGRGRVPPARIEFENLRALRAQGFEVPEPLGWGRAIGGGSFALLRPVEGEPLDDWLRAPRASRAPARAHLLRTLATLLARFHGNGWFHRDLYACHLLVGPGEALALIDLSRARRARRLRRRWRVKDLAALASSTPSPLASRTERLRFLLLYLGKRRCDAGSRRLLARVVRRAERMRARVPRDARK